MVPIFISHWHIYIQNIFRNGVRNYKMNIKRTFFWQDCVQVTLISHQAGDQVQGSSPPHPLEE